MLDVARGTGCARASKRPSGCGRKCRRAAQPQCGGAARGSSRGCSRSSSMHGKRPRPCSTKPAKLPASRPRSPLARAQAWRRSETGGRGTSSGRRSPDLAICAASGSRPPGARPELARRYDRGDAARGGRPPTGADSADSGEAASWQWSSQAIQPSGAQHRPGTRAASIKGSAIAMRWASDIGCGAALVLNSPKIAASKSCR